MEQHRLAISMASQATRLAALRESVGSLTGLGSEMQRAVARATETQSLPTLLDFDAGFAPASEMVKCIWYDSEAGLGAPFKNYMGALMGCVLSPDRAKLVLNTVVAAISLHRVPP